jgi:hypothetical protein
MTDMVADTNLIVIATIGGTGAASRLRKNAVQHTRYRANALAAST